jgi:hypothetical protein
MGDDDLDLAKQHVSLAKDIVSEKAKKKSLNKKSEKEFVEAEFALERAESEIEDLEKI